LRATAALNLSAGSGVLHKGFSYKQDIPWEELFVQERPFMFALIRFRSAAQKSLAVMLAALIASAAFAQEGQQSSVAPAPQAQSSVPPLTGLPQAPAPHHNVPLYSDQNYARSQSAFPLFWKPYTSRTVPEANLTNSSRVDQIFRDGKIYLSIDDAVALALENNLDITLQRYNLSIADTDILLSSSGVPNRGVNAGVVQGTLGGAIGSTSTGGTGSAAAGATGTGAGGTQVGVGGAGAGAAGLVLSTLGAGPPIDNFDPQISGTIQGERATTVQSNTVFTGTTSLIQNTNTYNFSYTQGFSTGTLASLTFNNSRITTNSFFNIVTPALQPAFRFQLRQHLLQGFGFDPNLRYIRITRNNREIGDIVFRQQVITTVSQIENIYWDLVTAYEAVKVNERALELADKVLSDDQEQVRIGTMAPITLAQAQSGVASAKQNLITSQTNLQLEQLLMKNAITKNIEDPLLANAPVIPTDTLKPNEQYEVRPTEDLVAEALQARPEIATARINLTNLEISKKSLKNALLPSLDGYAFYGASSLAGQQNPAVPTCMPGMQTTDCYTPGLIPTQYGTAFSNLFNSTAPDKGIGVTLNVPLRNRQAQANQVRSDLEYRQSQVALKQTENTIALQVRQAQFALQQNYAALQAAIAARDYARESLQAEQKKFQYGASTPTLVLQASSNLTSGESNVLNAAANYEKSKVTLDFVTAETLTKLGIDLTDAEAGKVQHVPNVKGVVPADVNDVLGPQQNAAPLTPPATPPPAQAPPPAAQPQAPPQ
jgi:outer membrane protein TolC